ANQRVAGAVATAARAASAYQRGDSAVVNSMSTRGRLLGIDHGEKVIGLAICDANWIAARPLELLVRRTRAQDFAHINAVIAQQEIAAIVVGLPELPPDHNVTGQANTVRRWVTRLASAVSVP